MRCFLIGCCVALLFGADNAFAQTAATARTIQSSVLLSDPRGDSALIAPVPPGVVVEVFARSGDWYRARTMGSPVRVGWIHRTVIEFLSPDAAAALPVEASVRANGPRPAPQNPREATLPLTESEFAPGRTELIVDGGLSGWNAAGETVGVFQLDGLVGVSVSSHLEVVVSTSVLKASGVNAFGSIGGGLVVNFVERRSIIPFVGGVVGRGFRASSLFSGLVDDPTFVSASGGFRVLTRGGGGALIVRPFYERYFNSSDVVRVEDVNRFGISLGASILF